MSSIGLLSEDITKYVTKNSSPEHSSLIEIREVTKAVEKNHMQISPLLGQFMGLLVRIINARKTLEIGTFTGYSALAVALSLPPDGEVITLDINEHTTNIARNAWDRSGVGYKITSIVEPALGSLTGMIKQGLAGTFDFAFIDADKVNLVDYYELSLTLLRSGGLIAIDNVFWSGRVWDETFTDENTLAIRIFNEILKNDRRVISSIVPIGDGLSLVYKL